MILDLFRKYNDERWRSATAAASLHCCSSVAPAHQGSGFAVQSLLDLLLGLLGQGAPDDRPAELTERLDGVVWGHLLDDHEQRRGPRLELPADLVDEVLVDTGLLDLAEDRSEACPERYAQDRNEEQNAEERSPEQSPHRPSSDRVMVGSGLVLPVLVTHDRRNGIGLDHEVRLEPVDLVHGRRSRGGVGIRDRDQVGHQDPPSSRDVSSDQDIMICFCTIYRNMLL